MFIGLLKKNKSTVLDIDKNANENLNHSLLRKLKLYFSFLEFFENENFNQFIRNELSNRKEKYKNHIINWNDIYSEISIILLKKISITNNEKKDNFFDEFMSEELFSLNFNYDDTYYLKNTFSKLFFHQITHLQNEGKIFNIIQKSMNFKKTFDLHCFLIGVKVGIEIFKLKLVIPKTKLSKNTFLEKFICSQKKYLISSEQKQNGNIFAKIHCFSYLLLLNNYFYKEKSRIENEIPTTNLNQICSLFDLKKLTKELIQDIFENKLITNLNWETDSSLKNECYINSIEFDQFNPLKKNEWNEFKIKLNYLEKNENCVINDEQSFLRPFNQKMVLKISSKNIFSLNDDNSKNEKL